jgi:hypothetical protein
MHQACSVPPSRCVSGRPRTHCRLQRLLNRHGLLVRLAATPLAGTAGVMEVDMAATEAGIDPPLAKP